MSQKLSLIVHIGMGKTGTTSIQKAMSENSGALSSQGARYLGMWFDMLSPDYHGLSGQSLFFKDVEINPEEMALRFMHSLREMERADAARIFILVNESIFEQGASIIPFFSLLAGVLDLRVVLYARNPIDWIDSAYTQWGIVHKTKPGRVASFEDLAPELMRLYSPIELWANSLKHNMTVRNYDGLTDVVQDFKEFCGLFFTHTVTRELSRVEDAELLLRAFFNDRLDGEVLPEEFERIVQIDDIRNVPSHSDLINRCFRRESIDQLIYANQEVFSSFRNGFQVDLVSQRSAGLESRDKSGINDRLVDYLIAMSLGQAARIKALESTIEEMKKMLNP